MNNNNNINQQSNDVFKENFMDIFKDDDNDNLHVSINNNEHQYNSAIKENMKIESDSSEVS